MSSPAADSTPVDPALLAFIKRWSAAAAHERSNYVLFLTELCTLLDLPQPDPAGPNTADNAYVFERSVPLHHPDGKVTTGAIDLYRRGCFVLEAKQYAEAAPEQPEFALQLADAAQRKAGIRRGTDAWDRAMLEARGQAENYARNLPASEEPPPFLIALDVGHTFALYADFTQKGKTYLPFPDARTYRIRLTDLARPEIRERLRQVWLDPHALDPAKKAAVVTREVAQHLAELARIFEKKHEPKQVAAFLSRCLFCMFAEDIGLLPKDGFRSLLDSVQGDPSAAVPMLKLLFEDMNEGRYSGLLREKLLHFNGGLFAEAGVLPLDKLSLGLLRQAASLEWRHVEPAIFGTLLERALDPGERHKLGAHYTPRAYVERLVLPTVIEPLREEWEAVRTAAVTLATRGDLKGAIKQARTFHHELCDVRVLDPACGSGNFLYVTLEHMKRLEGEVLELIESFGENMRLDLAGETIDPHQFLGIEINPRAATVAELVLWIGYLQWHHRNRGSTEWPEPVLKAFKNIECRDAVLAYDGFPEPVLDENRIPICRWDGRTTKTNPITGREIPDESALVPLLRYKNPNRAEWPTANFVVGNPPFIGTRRMRLVLGDGYVDALGKAHPDVPENADFVMYWWHQAAELIKSKRLRRFGLITTNSIRQSFNRAVVNALRVGENQGSIIWAVPDHPWVDSTDGAAVRIAMTVVAQGQCQGSVSRVIQEADGSDGSVEVKFQTIRGFISADLTTGASTATAGVLNANAGLAYWGVKFYGDGFIVSDDDRDELSRRDGGRSLVRPFVSGRDLTGPPRKLQVIDCDGFDEPTLRRDFPATYERLLTHVKPVRAHNPRAFKRERWWIFGENQPGMRAASRSVDRCIFTTETAKHRVFQFFNSATLAEGTVAVIALDDAFPLGVLSSRIHVVFALEAGGTLEDRPRYNKTRCFDPFPFPDCTDAQKQKIRALAEELDAHRKRAQAAHQLGLTDIYNVLEKIRAGEELTKKDRAIHDAALVSTLKQLHDDLDAAVADAYGWPWPLTDAEILERVVALNAERAAEEARGLIRWLRPDYQARSHKPMGGGQKQLGLDGNTRDLGSRATDAKGSRRKAAKARKLPWPKTLPERSKAVDAALASAAAPVTAADLAEQFARAKPADVAEILDTLVALGRARPGHTAGTFVR